MSHKQENKEDFSHPVFNHNIRPVTQRFKLDESTRKELKSRTPKFGFNGLGEVVFRRTYSRNNESWYDVVIRVIEGVMSIRKEHFFRNSLRWVDTEWQPFAKKMAHSMFSMEWLPPGRGLWMMGTEFCYTRGAMALINCAATDTSEDIVLSAEWTMDGLMNGAGVGFTTNWRGKATMPDKSKRKVFVIPDSREGWVESLVKLMCAYIDSPRYGKNAFPQFDYSQIRPAGKPIRGFGGQASGPGPLQKLHERIEGYLDAFCKGDCPVFEQDEKFNLKDTGKTKPYTHTRLIADIFNAIGACVVAGNVRRCLPGNAEVFTRSGMKPIRDVVVGEEVLTSQGYEKIINKFDQGVQSLVKIVTQDGDFRCTPNHRMAVCTSYDEYDWKEAQHLKPGDRLLSSRMELEGTETKLPSWTYEKVEHSTTCKDIVPPELDADMAWFIGLFQGDGYTYPNYKENGFNAYVSIVCGLNEYSVAEKAKEQIERFGDLHVTLKKRKNENSFIVHCQSKQLAWYLDKNVKQANTEIRTPDYIKRAKCHVKLAYVAGVTDANGCLKNRPVQVVTTVYEKFARDLQNILYSCGLESRFVTCSDDWKSRKGCQRLYNVNLITKRSQQLFSEIPELHKEMKKTSRSQNANGFPTSFETTPKIKTKYALYNNKQFNIDAYDRQYGKSWFVPTEVISVVDDTKEETYDIEVENRHEFFCNGYLTHNSAEICLGDVEDKDFINLKNYKENPERGEIGWMSNNSVVLESGYDFSDFNHIPDMAARIRDNGEPGMINLYNVQKFGRYGKEMKDEASLVNPCVPDDTWVTTAQGAVRVRDLIGKPFQAMVDGKLYECKTGFFSTGCKPVFKLVTKEGFELRATANHKIMTADNEWVELKDLVEGDKIKVHQHSISGAMEDNEEFSKGWLIGSLYGDGTFDYRRKYAYLDYWGETAQEMAEVATKYLNELKMDITPYDYPQYDKVRLNSKKLFILAQSYISRGKILTDEVEKQDPAFIQGFLRGWFDADGSVQGNRKKGVSVRLTCINLDSLKKAQRMALRLGIYSKIYQERHPVRDKLMPDGKGGMKLYHCNADHELVISRSSIKTYDEMVGFWETPKSQKLKEILASYKRPLYGTRFEATVESIELDGECEVYDATIEDIHAFDANGIYVHNCGEISLCNFELCNLSETFPPRCENADRFYAALKFACFYSSTVALLPTHRPETNAIIAKNRRIGVSVSGIAQWASSEVPDGWGHMSYTKMTRYLREGYKLVRAENKRLAEAAGVPTSIRVTTVKPSGSISLLAGVTPGVHYPVSRYAIRRIRIGEDSPLVQPLIDAGIPHEKDTYSDNTLVFEFVIDHGAVRPCEEVSPWEQFSLVAMMQRCWADNCVSATIYFDKEKDGNDVEKMLAMYIPILKSVSMLPHSGHGYSQAPYEPIDKKVYEERLSKYRQPKFDSVVGNVPVGSKFCNTANCEV